jgi:hypothetical protein
LNSCEKAHFPGEHFVPQTQVWEQVHHLFEWAS